ncbi:MAG: response regulator [Bacteroidales bacterium]|nr:response regulator [Bacteroidales bacterium]MBN2747894.1 response regulator [Bacteroidales bacterium]
MPKQKINTPISHFRYRLYQVLIVLFFTSGLITSYFLGKLDVQNNLSEQRVKVVSELSTVRAKLEGIITSTFSITQGIVHTISIQGGIKPSYFEPLGLRALKENRYIRHIAIAPNNTISMVYPLAGNESAIGLNYNTFLPQRESIYRAKSRGQAVLAGPTKLVQGGEALILRQPVFTQLDDTSSYWGVVSIVAFINPMLFDGGVTSSKTLNIAIIGRDGLGLSGEMIAGDPKVFNKNPVLQEVIVPGGSWFLAATPRLGWVQPLIVESWYFWIVCVNALVISVFVMLLLKKNYQIRQKNSILAHEIDVRRKVESELALNEVKYRNLVEDMRDVVIRLDISGTVIYCSPSIFHFCGLSVDQLLGKTLSSFIESSDETSLFYKFLESVVSDDNQHTTEIRFSPCYSKQIIVELSVKLIRRHDGSPESFHCVLRDVTERKKMQEELVRSKDAAESANRMKTAFLANMSHEIRTPMNSIQGFSNLLLSRDIDKERMRAYLELINKSSQNLLNVISDIIDVSVIESGHLKISPKVTNLNSLLDNLFSMHWDSAQAKGLSLSVQKGLTNELSTIEVDEYRLTQVLSNLVGNAIKFTKQGSVRFGYYLNEGTVMFSVSDTGIGIPSDFKDVVFERFRQVDEYYSRSQGGTGLGLSISKALVEAMGGEIWLESLEHQGATFYFTIPYKNVADHVIAQSKPEMVIPTLHAKIVLVAEDDTANYQLIEALLGELNSTVVWAQNGAEAVAAVENGLNPDLILMDIKMPVMSGLEATSLLRTKGFSNPIVALTAFAMDEDRTKAIAMGCNGYLSKPIDVQVFWKVLGNLVKS